MLSLTLGGKKMNDFIEINILARPIYKKCKCCDIVADIYYQVNIKNVKNKKLVQGTLQLCRVCGENLNTILGNELAPGEEIVKTFNFNI